MDVKCVRNTLPITRDKSLDVLIFFHDTAQLIFKGYYTYSSVLCAEHVGVIQGCIGCSLSCSAVFRLSKDKIGNFESFSDVPISL